jgi:hypothetical protein
VNTYSGVTRITGGSQSALTFASASSNTVAGNIYVNGGSSARALNVDGFVGLSFQFERISMSASAVATAAW